MAHLQPERLLVFLLCLLQGHDVNSQTVGYSVSNSTGDLVVPIKPPQGECFLSANDDNMHKEVAAMIDAGVKLIEYTLVIANSTDNPFQENLHWLYQLDKWARVTSKHGQALLALSFNYGALSLTTLTFGVRKIKVELVESLSGCFSALNEDGKQAAIQQLLIRDFKTSERTTLKYNEFLCHQVIVQSGYYGKITERCCHTEEDGEEEECHLDTHNVWINVIDILLTIIKVVVFLFGPIFIPARIYSDEFDTHRFIVKFKDTLRKTIRITHSKAIEGFTTRFMLDIRNKPGFRKFREFAKTVQKNENIPVKMNEFNLSIPFRKLQVENKVHVGLLNSLMKAICLCNIRDVEPCKQCCTSNMLACCNPKKPVPWIRLFRVIGRMLLVLALPTPYYVRLIFYYVWENDEMQARQDALENVGYTRAYDNKLLTYLSPVHPVSVIIYIIYLLTAFMLCTPPEASKLSQRFRRLVIDAFRDLHRLSWLDAVAFVTSVFLWPLRKFGLVGCLIGLVYWPLLMPIAIVLCCIYCLPLIYLTCRMLISSRSVILGSKQTTTARVQKVKKRTDLLEGFLSKVSPKEEDDKLDEDEEEDVSCKNILLQMVVGIFCVISLLAVTFMLTECVCFLVDMGVFTLMGIIANAGATLRYVTLILLICLYSFDIFNNVNKEYLKLNTALFSDIKGRIKGLQEVTMLPSHLQQNRGFKSLELSEQADFEQPDMLWRKKDSMKDRSPLCWLVNDLLLFVDSEDLPRIPRKLFEQVCNICVAGAPGPVYRSLLRATGQFMTIIFFLLFVFLVVLSFGDAYGISTTNQTLATVAGGFLPYILRTFLSPKPPPISLGSLTFKTKMDEVIKGFRQAWPVADLPFVFDDGTEEEEDAEEQARRSSSSNSSSGATDSPTDAIDKIPLQMHAGDLNGIEETAGMTALMEDAAERERHARKTDKNKNKESKSGSNEEKQKPAAVATPADPVEVDPKHVDLLIIMSAPKSKQSVAEQELATLNETGGDGAQLV